MGYEWLTLFYYEQFPFDASYYFQNQSITFLLLILISLFSCNNDDNIEGVKILLVGRWEGVAVLREDITNNFVSSSQQQDFSGNFWTFEADGVFIAEIIVPGFDTLTFEAAWTLLSENQLIINSEPNDIITIITLDSQNLVLKQVVRMFKMKQYIGMKIPFHLLEHRRFTTTI